MVLGQVLGAPGSHLSLEVVMGQVLGAPGSYISPVVEVLPKRVLNASCQGVHLTLGDLGCPCQRERVLTSAILHLSHLCTSMLTVVIRVHYNLLHVLHLTLPSLHATRFYMYR